eukprot:TRINITY_DN1160_c0_g1_i2.p1 TRINITY_DN1160_c0_g1~~TRINITY_DN1160_c0_g1_i2.p1  ORF type:complete len:282 (-),score=68.88 TRINITY_DN1160_c0_g1_i2:80-925(-)
MEEKVSKVDEAADADAQADDKGVMLAAEDARGEESKSPISSSRHEQSEEGTQRVSTNASGEESAWTTFVRHTDHIPADFKQYYPQVGKKGVKYREYLPDRDENGMKYKKYLPAKDRSYAPEMDEDSVAYQKYLRAQPIPIDFKQEAMHASDYTKYMPASHHEDNKLDSHDRQVMGEIEKKLESDSSMEKDLQKARDLEKQGKPLKDVLDALDERTEVPDSMKKAGPSMLLASQPTDQQPSGLFAVGAGVALASAMLFAAKLSGRTRDTHIRGLREPLTASV